MSQHPLDAVDPTRDLVLERVVDVPPESVWLAWTDPSRVMQWFAPAPWTTVGCEIDLRPGGMFRTVMRSPEGQEFDNVGCYLEVRPHERLVWTDALAPGYRPVQRASDELSFTAIITLASQGSGTKYTAIALHKNAEDRAQHAAMGFHEGWGMALDQLVAVAKKL